MLINIFLNINPGPYGGGNQFLKALRAYFVRQAVWAETPEEADVILFNSHHQIKELIGLKRRFPDKIFIHRLDGPVYLIRKDSVLLDKLIYKLNNRMADATIFQSDWSKFQNQKLGLKPNIFETTIINAPDPNLFNNIDKQNFEQTRKTKLIATSWATNKSKGFETYTFLDNTLDFSNYEMTFCGNSPVTFKNIKHIKALPSNELAAVLKAHDIFISASENDPCSNSLIEALHCGLPALAYHDGGHPEIIKNAGLTYRDPKEIEACLKTITSRYKDYQNQIQLPSMDDIGSRYLSFMASVYKEKKSSNSFKQLKAFTVARLRFYVYFHKLVHRLYEITHKK